MNDETILALFCAAALQGFATRYGDNEDIEWRALYCAQKMLRLLKDGKRTGAEKAPVDSVDSQ